MARIQERSLNPGDTCCLPGCLTHNTLYGWSPLQGEILRNAAQLFETVGYEGTTMKAIAAPALMPCSVRPARSGGAT